MRPYLLIAFIISSSSIHSQFRPDNEEDNYFVRYLDMNNEYERTYRRDSSGGFFFKVDSDTNNTVFISKDYGNFKLYDKNNNLIVEGDLGGRKYTDFFKKFGKWTAYYPSGKTKWTGYYYAGIATGLWKYYYPNGQLKRTFTLAPIETDSFFINRKVGLYEEYYENGNIQSTGFFKIAIDTTKYKYIIGASVISRTP